MDHDKLGLARDVDLTVTASLLGAFPTRYAFRGHDRIRVEWRGDDRWAIIDGGLCLNNAGEWELEPQPSSRDEDFIQRTRFPLVEALRLGAQESRLDHQTEV